MRKSYIYTFLCTIALIQLSCTKDKGNYTYTDINTIKISVTGTTFNIEQLDRLTITPSLEESKPNEQNQYSYEWLIYPARSPVISGTQEQKEIAILLSTNKDLDVVISQPPNSYFLQYNVINNQTGIKSSQRFNVNVTALFYEGWLVMTNMDNLAKLSFIRSDDAISLDPLKNANNTSLKGKGIASYSAVGPQISNIFIFTNEEILRLAANDLTIEANQDNIFTESPQGYTPFFSLSSSSGEQFIISNGKLHATTVNSPWFGAPSKYSVRYGGESNNVFPFLFHGDKTYISVYDMDKKRFLHAAMFNRSLQTFTTNPNDNYDLANVGNTMIAADLGTKKVFDIIMKNDNNQFYYYAYNPSENKPAVSYHVIKDSPSIDEAISFASSSAIKHIYYATQDKIYLYDILANSARLVYQFPSDTKMKMISMYKHKGWGSTNAVDPAFNKRLVVATNTETEGKVYYFNISPTGDFENQTFNKVFTGFAEIEHINYRNINQ